MLSDERAKLITLASSTFGVPIRLVEKDGKVVYSAPEIDPGADPVRTSQRLTEHFAPLMSKDRQPTSSPAVIWDKHNLVFAAFRSKYERGSFLLVGPIVTWTTFRDSSPAMIQYYQIQNADAFRDLIQYRCSSHPYRRAIDIVRLMFYMEWGYICSDSFTTIFPEPMEQYDFDRKLIDYSFFVRENQSFDLSVDDFFSVLNFVLSSEDSAAIQKLEDVLAEGKRQAEGMRLSEKQSLIEAKYVFWGVLSILYKAALDAGMDKATAESLWHSYMQQGNEAHDYYAIDMLYRSIVIDYASRFSSSGASYSPRIKTAIEYIGKNLHYELDLSALSDSVGLNPRYLSSLFKKETGLSIQEYILDQKIREAREALSLTDGSVQEISTYLNFSSQSYFSKVFKKHTGMTPQQYRQRFSPNRSGVLKDFPTMSLPSKKGTEET